MEGSGRSREKSTPTLRNILQSRKLKELGGNTFEAETLFERAREVKVKTPLFPPPLTAGEQGHLLDSYTSLRIVGISNMRDI